jgi:hypothetical protein
MMLTYYVECVQRDGRLGEALKAFEAAARLNPLEPDVWNWLALTHKHQISESASRDYDPVLQLLSKSMELRPASPTLMGNIAATLAQGDRYAEAGAWFERALRADPESVTILYNAATMLHVEQKPEEALSLYSAHLRMPLALLEWVVPLALVEIRESGSDFLGKTARVLCADYQMKYDQASDRAQQQEHALQHQPVLCDLAYQLQVRSADVSNHLALLLWGQGRLQRQWALLHDLLRVGLGLGEAGDADDGISRHMSRHGQNTNKRSCGGAGAGASDGDGDGGGAEACTGAEADVHQADVHLLVAFYAAPTASRRREIAQCLHLNIQNRFVTHVHIFTEQWLDLSFLDIPGADGADGAAGADGAVGADGAAGADGGHDTTRSNGRTSSKKNGRKKKATIKQVVSASRLTFHAAFDYANTQLAGRICILANADIFFDETLGGITGGSTDDSADDSAYYLPNGVVLGLLRWDHPGDGGAYGMGEEYGMGGEYGMGSGSGRASFYLQPRTDSQDAWIFRAPLPELLGANFSLGRPGADNRLAHVLRSHGLHLANACFHVKAHHLHRSEQRSYEKKDLVRGALAHLPMSLSLPGCDV